MALDTYFRGNSQEVAYCQQIKAIGNHMVVATAGGKILGAGHSLRMRGKELDPVLKEYRDLPLSERKVKLADPSLAQAPKRPVPEAPEGGLVIRGFCTYMNSREASATQRLAQYYYKQNPDAWAAETQSDMLWLTRAERESLIPTDPKPGQTFPVSTAIQKRFFTTIGIEYMEGSVNALAPREMEMMLQVEAVKDGQVQMRLEGSGRMGKVFDRGSLNEERSRGCAVRVFGVLVVDLESQAFTRFDIVGLGRAWGSKMEYTQREISLDEVPWTYGIACELVSGDSPMDRIPPYNLLHYGAGLKYWE
ncbi:MAG: hypothetical protein ACI9QL_004196 [Candidatus Omnitrophota bacterium]